MKDPNLLLNIRKEYEARIKNEGDNATLIFLCGISSLLLRDGGVNAIIESASSAGKSYIAETVLFEHFPEVDVNNPDEWGLVIANHLTNAGLTRLAKHLDKKLIYQGEMGESQTEENKQVNQTLRQIMSGGRYVRYLADKKTNALEKLDIKGKPTCISTTASLRTEIQTSNRYIHINLDESKRQNEVIVDFVFEHHFNKPQPTSEYITQVVEELKDEFRLPPGRVYNPYAKSVAKILKDNYSSDVHIRRVASQVKGIIETITLLYSLQRETAMKKYGFPKTVYVVSSKEDVYNALYLLNEVVDQSIFRIHRTSTKLLELIANNYKEGETFGVAEIADKAGITKHTAYPKLKNLFEGGFLTKTKVGREISYSFRTAKTKSLLIVPNSTSVQFPEPLVPEARPDFLEYNSAFYAEGRYLRNQCTNINLGTLDTTTEPEADQNSTDVLIGTIRADLSSNIHAFLQTDEDNGCTWKELQRQFNYVEINKLKEAIGIMILNGVIYEPNAGKYKMVG